MKTFMLFIFCLGSFFSSFAQDGQTVDGVRSLPTVYLKKGVTVHFISPENITYVDIPLKYFNGDIPLKNMLKVRLTDSLAAGSHVSVLTITGEKYVAQFNLVYDEGIADSFIKSYIEISPEMTRLLDFPELRFSKSDFRDLCAGIMKKPQPGHKIKSHNFGITGQLNNIYTLGEYIFLDLTYLNPGNLVFDIDRFHFSIEDKKINTATTAQSIALKPEYSFVEKDSFTHQYRNVFVFRKFSFPGHKVFKVSLSEKQFSGRVVELKINYRNLLQADTLIPK